MIGLAEAALLLAACVGVAGAVVPFVPGTELSFAAALAYAWWTGFTVIGGFDLAVLGILAVMSFGADFLLGAGGARRCGAGRAGVVGAVAGLFIGMVALGPLGIVAGPVAGAVCGELLYGKQWRQALRAGIGAGVGALLAMLARLVISFLMLVYIGWQVLAQR